MNAGGRGRGRGAVNSAPGMQSGNVPGFSEGNYESTKIGQERLRFLSSYHYICKFEYCI